MGLFMDWKLQTELSCPQFSFLARLFIYKLTGLLDITGLWSITNGAKHYELSLKLLPSVNYETTVAYRAIRSFHFHHL